MFKTLFVFLSVLVATSLAGPKVNVVFKSANGTFLQTSQVGVGAYLKTGPLYPTMFTYATSSVSPWLYPACCEWSSSNQPISVYYDASISGFSVAGFPPILRPTMVLSVNETVKTYIRVWDNQVQAGPNYFVSARPDNTVDARPQADAWEMWTVKQCSGNYASDPLNCGACGYVCQNGGSCASGVCQCTNAFRGTLCELLPAAGNYRILNAPFSYLQYGATVGAPKTTVVSSVFSNYWITSIDSTGRYAFYSFLNNQYLGVVNQSPWDVYTWPYLGDWEKFYIEPTGDGKVYLKHVVSSRYVGIGTGFETGGTGATAYSIATTTPSSEQKFTLIPV